MIKSHEIRNLLVENREILLNGATNNGICYDGIVDEENYRNIVVLLKETNGCDANGNLPENLEDWDYCNWLKEQQAENKPEERINKNGEKYTETNVFYPSTFRKLCYWLSLLCDTLDNEKVNPEKFMKDGKVDVEKVRTILKSVAVVNLKKTWGNKNTDRGELVRYVLNEEIREVLVKQMDALNPQVVLCCSPDVFNLATLTYAEDWNIPYTVPSKTMPGKDICLVYMNGAIYIDFYHPQYYGKTDEQFSAYAVEVFEHTKAFMTQAPETYEKVKKEMMERGFM